MRTLDMLDAANDAPKYDFDYAAISREVARAISIALLPAMFAVALLRVVEDPMIARIMLVFGAPALASVFVWPMAERRGLDKLSLHGEKPGLVGFVLSIALAVVIMKTFGDVALGDRPPLNLWSIAVVPGILSLAAWTMKTYGTSSAKIDPATR